MTNQEAIEVAKKLEVGLMMTPSKTRDEEYNLIKSAETVRILISIAERVDEEKIIKLYLEREGFTDCKDNEDFQDQLLWIKDFAHAIIVYLQGEQK